MMIGRLDDYLREVAADNGSGVTESDIRQAGLAAFADAVLDSAPQRAAWLGWSLGGLATLNLARLYPDRVRGLIQLASTPRFVASTDWPYGVEAAVFDQFAAGLKDLEGFSHVILLYQFHRIAQTRLTVIPFMDHQPRGVFATRAPTRPNPIGLSTVKLLGIEGTVLHIENVDIVDGTPLLDIKPYVPQFDHHEVERTGWLENSKENVKEKRSDDRFN